MNKQMDEMHRKLKSKLEEMRKVGNVFTTFTFEEVAEMYQLICMMMQIKEIVKWVE